MNSELLFYVCLHTTNVVESMSLSVYTQKWSAINGISKSDGKIKSADMKRLDLLNTSNILWGILLPSMRDGQSKNSLNCYWSQISASLCMCVCMHSHMHVACIHIYYKKHKRSTFQCTEQQILHNIGTLKPSGEKCYSSSTYRSYATMQI